MLYGIVLSALNATLAFVLKKVVVKALLFGGLFFVVHEFTGLVIEKLFPSNGATSLTNSFSSLTPEIWYFLDLTAVPLGVPMILSAYVSRFILRRIPIIG